MKMKFLIASDLHGSAYWCERLLEAVAREGADRVLFLGDVLYHGPRNDLPRDYAPKRVITMLSAVKEKLLCVRGNCDGEVDQMVLPFPMLADYAVLPVGRHLVYMTHGHHYHEEALPPLCKGDVLLHGHTHVPVCHVHEDHVCMNPGSVSIPKEDSWHGYMVLEGNTFRWMDFDGVQHMTYTLPQDE